ncbi:CFEM domain-containing protein [Dichotomopilus funicola]|uniref:CFEM domain-containing protein n=1 Tax=Dichotomopilus funicola TaxID=1934379 RepID=A0AAN6V5Y7_9PEZI|nr:CFEM domain-containing protein [Dichotomopilus funicola]
MRPIFSLAVAFLAALVPRVVVAQDMSAVLQQLPQCALSCLVDGVTHSSCSQDLTPGCICNNEALQTNISTCVTKHCTVKESLVAKNATDTACGLPVRNRASTYDTTSMVLASISIGLVIIRVCFKLFVMRNMAKDDYVVIVLVLFALPSLVLIHIGTAPDTGKDIWALRPDQITHFLLYFYLMAIFYFIQVALVKLCLLFFYLRIFPSQGVRRLLWGTMVFTVLFGVFFTILTIFECTPMSYFWNQWDGEHEGMCLNVSAIAWSNAAISIALDVWMLAIPLGQIRSLNLHWKKKIGVAMMFIVGTFVTIVSIIRLHAIVSFASSANVTWDNFPVLLWSTVEINVGIMCTCMPTLRLMLVRYFPRLGGGSSYANRGRGYYPSIGGGGPHGGRSGGASGAGGAGMSGRSGKLGGSGLDTNDRSMLSHKGLPLGNVATTTFGGDDTYVGHDDDLTTRTPGSSGSIDSMTASKGATGTGIIRHQTFAVQYDDDDETNLVEMGELRGRNLEAVGENGMQRPQRTHRLHPQHQYTRDKEEV